MTALRWILVLPGALLFWVAGDFIASLLLNAIIFLGQFVRFAPIVDLLSKYGGYQFVLFASFLSGVYGGTLIAPSKKKVVSIILLAFFISLRLYMTYLFFKNPNIIEDTPAQFIIGTILAIIGASLGAYLAVRLQTEH